MGRPLEGATKQPKSAPSSQQLSWSIVLLISCMEVSYCCKPAGWVYAERWMTSQRGGRTAGGILTTHRSIIDQQRIADSFIIHYWSVIDELIGWVWHLKPKMQLNWSFKRCCWSCDLWGDWIYLIGWNSSKYWQGGWGRWQRGRWALQGILGNKNRRAEEEEDSVQIWMTENLNIELRQGWIIWI